MNAVLGKFLAIQGEFFEKIQGKVKPVILPDYPNPHGDRYTLSLNTCIECYPEEGWPQKLGELLTKHGVDLDKFVAMTKATSMGFYLDGDKLSCQLMSSCPKIPEVL